MDDRTIRTVTGYGASLRRQLDAIGWSQGRLASESSTSRQTISRAINRDEISDRTRARLDAALGRAGTRRRSNRRTGLGAGAPTLASALCDGTDLAAWADRRAAQGLLPLAIRRLVQATGLGVSKLTVRTDEGIHLPGWDGIVHAGRASAFVPQGTSGWEMSVGRNPGVKAEENWEKRTKDPGALAASETTFVFVTPRRWSAKEKWAAQKIEEGPWRNVRALDADDLAAWLEEAPAVHTWLSMQIGKIPPDTRDLKTHWERWAEATYPPLTRRFLLSRRNNCVADLHRRLSEMSGQVLAIQAESRSEAIAWLYCAIRELDSQQAEAVLARCLVVGSKEALQHLISANPPLVLVPSFDPDELAAAAARAGHTVVVPLDEAAPGHEGDLLPLGPLCRRSAADALREVGIEHGRAYEMAGFAIRSLKAWRRSMAVAPGFRKPEWARPAVGRGVLPALLVGSWKDSNPNDCEVISKLAGRPYKEVAASLIRWSVGSDPVVRRRDDLWYLVSAQDAWELLRPYMMRDDLDRLETAATTVLGSVHPAFELPAEQRWLAGVFGFSAQYSGFLSDGLARTLAIMGVHGSEVPSAMSSARQAAERVVRKLLGEANRDWRLWASLSTRLRFLAEAAPDQFLDAVEAGLEGPEPILADLFSNNRDPMLGSHDHTWLLRALEVVAWSADHLGRVATLLARLDKVDPQSELRPSEDPETRSFPRPLSVLKEIFRSWRPQTSAPLAERLAVLDGLRASHGEVAWHVMRSMLPEAHAVGHPTARPSFRGWAADDRRALELEEHTNTTSEIVLRMLDDAESSGRKWAELLASLDMLPRREHELVLAAVRRLDTDEVGQETRLVIWEAIRSMVDHHRAFRTAKWAMPEEYVKRLANIRDRFAPSDPVALHGWLFGRRPRLVDDGSVGATSGEDEWQRLTGARVEAVGAIVRQGGLDGLRTLARSVEDPYQVGRAAADVPLSARVVDQLLSNHLGDAEGALSSFAFGYAAGQSRRSGPDWVIRHLERADLGLNRDQKVTLLLTLPARPETWQVVAGCGADVSLAYWQRIPPERLWNCHLAEAVDGLLEAGRSFAAVDLLAFEGQVDVQRVPPHLAASVLDIAALAVGESDIPDADISNSAGFLLHMLARANYDEAHLAKLEWRLTPVLSPQHRNPVALHRLLSRDPVTFVDILSLVYRADCEEPEEVSLEDERRATSGYVVLKSWRTIPGYKDDLEMDGTGLRRWLDDALPALAEAGRAEIGHHMIGQMLSASPNDPDGTWPCAAVRDAIEDLASPNLEEGFQVGVLNSRGMVTKDPSSGGAAERALAEQYDGFSLTIRATHPRTARMLRGVAEQYRQDASRQDFQSVMIEER